MSRQIHNAAQHPVNLDQRLVDAVAARIMVDLEIGAAFTRWQTWTLNAKFRQLYDIQLLSYGTSSTDCCSSYVLILLSRALSVPHTRLCGLKVSGYPEL